VGCAAGGVRRQAKRSVLPFSAMPQTASPCSPPVYYCHSCILPYATHAPRPLQLKGYAAASNVRGTVFLETIGINAADLTRDIVVTDCFYLGLVSEGGEVVAGPSRAGRRVAARCTLQVLPSCCSYTPHMSVPLCPTPLAPLQALLAFVRLYLVMPRPQWAHRFTRFARRRLGGSE